MVKAPGSILWRYPQLLLISYVLRKERMFLSLRSVPSLSFRTWHSVCLSPSPWTWLIQWYGGLNQINRNQGHQEAVNTIAACIVQTQEGEPLEMNFRKAPDLQKDDLAQRRIQGRLTPHREAPSFIKLSGITEADLETWERLKVSGETRCVMVSPPAVVGFNIWELSGYLCFIFCFDGWKEYLSTQSVWKWARSAGEEGSINTKNHVSRKHLLYPADFLSKWLFIPLDLLTIKNFYLTFE